MARRFVLVLGLVAIVAAVAQTPDEPTGLRESQCFGCHEVGGGSFGPPLTEMYAILTPANLSVPIGEPIPYDVTVLNTWTAELSAISGILNLSDAPSLGFASDQEPTSEQQDHAMPMGTARSVDTTVEVPGGATDLLFRISAPDAIIAPDLELRVYPPGSDDPFIADARGSGAPETLSIQGSLNIAELGPGAWTMEATQDILDQPSFSTPFDVRFELHTWSNVTGERFQATASPDILDGQEQTTDQEAVLPWRLLAASRPSAAESINITVFATAFYDHPGQTSGGLDVWHYVKTIKLGVYEDVEAPETTVIDAGERVATVTDDPLPWDRIGEIIGYVSSFLLVLSVLTGGIFGKASRRVLNRTFKGARRRVAFHNFVSYLLTLFAVGHTVLFIVEPGFPWTLGLIWGGIALLAMVFLGVTGALQVPIIRRWDYSTWRWTHLGLAIGSLVFTVVHLLLDGANFTEVAAWVGWQDPFQ